MLSGFLLLRLFLFFTRDPFNTLNIQRALIIAPNGMTAVYQDLGADTFTSVGNGR